MLGNEIMYLTQSYSTETLFIYYQKLVVFLSENEGFSIIKQRLNI